MVKQNFVKTESYRSKNNKEKQLIEAFLKLKTKDEVAAFLRDLLTIQEI
jgi:uncharacterized protein YerC